MLRNRGSSRAAGAAALRAWLGRAGARVFPLFAALALGACAAETEQAADAAATDAAVPADAAAAADAAPAMDAAAPAVSIVQPADGAEVTGPNVRIVLGASNITIAPAGDTLPNTGHHHLFVNTPITAPGEPIPAGQSGIIHLGKAQTEYELTDLAPGEYTVIAVIGDLVHRRIDPQAIDTVRFTVR